MNLFFILKKSLANTGNACKSILRRISLIIPKSTLAYARWLYLPRILSRREKILFPSLAVVAVLSGALLFSRMYLKITELQSTFGGTYREGTLVEPRFINPMYASSNDTDRDITQIVFAGLIRYSADGKAEPHLAESVEVDGDGKIYTARLRQNLKWHDNAPLTADDVLFTIKTIQNPDYKSPLRQNWQGVSVEKLDEQTIRFTLKQPYAPFIENLTVGIIPEHLWTKIPPNSAPLSDLNLKPIGAGPYQFESFTRRPDGSLISYTLRGARSFYRGRPHIKEIMFLFYPSEAELIGAYHKGEVDGIATLAHKSIPLVEKAGIDFYPLRLPKIVAVFFNAAHQGAFADKRIRQALASAINTDAIISKVLSGSAERIASPIPPYGPEKNDEPDQSDFNIEKAKELLAAAGWKDTNNDNMLERKETKNRKTTTTPLTAEISTSDFPELVAVAHAIKDAWRTIGVAAEVKIFSAADLEFSVIRPRAYQVLLFGEILGHDPDPFAFWHTSQMKDPGLNVALFSDRKADALLEEARRTGDAALREKKYNEFESIVVNDQAAIFLYRPIAYYGVRPTVKGIRIDHIALPHERFAFVEEWYMKTRRWFK